ncbi:SOS response-associated peptidase [Chitinolyticbacter albus]|uniref:SOS response-associated peptidase n=1 Tax=Chitinolyticbacter albus TaxID=2961951 RepID=UPI00210E6E96|nr:SOS response-associated peptidase [Chitinolyticbacter albus]
MCGRVAKTRQGWDYIEHLGWDHELDGLDDPPRYNVPPGTRQLMLHRLGEEGAPAADWVWWNYLPAWSKTKGGYPNARIEKVLGGSGYYRAPWEKRRRGIMPVDGWFEWLALEGGGKQPYYITAKNRQPLWLATITLFEPGQPSEGPEHGMAIITQDSVGGMVDVHDRRPVVFGQADVLAWLDPNVSPDLASQLLLHMARPGDEFEWWAVPVAIGNTRNQGAALIEPL